MEKNNNIPNEWKLIYRFMDNVKTRMDDEIMANNNVVTDNNIENIINWIKMSLDDIHTTCQRDIFKTQFFL